MQHDVSSESDWQKVFATTLEQFSKLDILINNAGIGLNRDLADTSLEDWQRLFKINTEGVFPGTGEVSPLVRPDDLSLVADDDGNGRVSWARYEGNARLYAVQSDDGTLLKVRCSHENKVQPDDRVRLQITTTHPLAVFNRESAE